VALGRLLNRATILVALAAAAGAVHSWIVPIQLRPVERAGDVAGREVAAPATAAEPGASSGAAPDAAADPAPGGAEQAGLGLEISLAQARALYEAGEADFIDARTAEEFARGRILGALHLPASAFSTGEAGAVLELLDPSRAVVIYCGGGDCDASHNTAVFLQQAGFERLHIMVEGYPAWAEAGYDVEGVPEDAP